jgi:hypothetical protein
MAVSNSSTRASFELLYNTLGHVSFDIISLLNKLGCLFVTSVVRFMKKNFYVKTKKTFFILFFYAYFMFVEQRNKKKIKEKQFRILYLILILHICNILF